MVDVLPADLVVLYQVNFFFIKMLIFLPYSSYFIKDAFAYFDTDNDGIITTKQLGPLLRHCGENPSEAEIQVGFFDLISNINCPFLDTRDLKIRIWQMKWILMRPDQFFFQTF